MHQESPPKKDGWCLVATEASRFWHEFCNGFFFAILRENKSWYLNTKAMAQNLFYAMSSKILVLLIVSSNEWTRGHEDCPSALVQPLEFTLRKGFFGCIRCIFPPFCPTKTGVMKDWQGWHPVISDNDWGVQSPPKRWVRIPRKGIQLGFEPLMGPVVSHAQKHPGSLIMGI